jgi:hypothetical protein
LEYPYKPFGYLKITASQLVFEKVFPGSNTFSGAINVADLVEVNYLKGTPIFGVPGLEILYRSSDNQIANVTIHFPGFSGRLGMEFQSGITPEKVFEKIVFLKEKMKQR